MTKTREIELYVTSVEQEAYDLGGQLCLAQVRTHVAPRVDKHGAPFYVVFCDAPEAIDRAIKVRRQMFGS